MGSLHSCGGRLQSFPLFGQRWFRQCRRTVVCVLSDLWTISATRITRSTWILTWRKLFFVIDVLWSLPATLGRSANSISCPARLGIGGAGTSGCRCCRGSFHRVRYLSSYRLVCLGSPS